MSDVGDVNQAHTPGSGGTLGDELETYLLAAQRVHEGGTMLDRMVFQSLHNAQNVITLGKIITALEEENRTLMEMLYGGLDGMG